MRVEAKELTKKFTLVYALRDVNLDLESKSICILGPNGSGKTTLLTIMTGLKHPTRGYFKLNDFIPYKERDKALKTLSYAFSASRLQIGIRVKDLVKMAKKEGLNKADDLMHILGLNNFVNQKIGNLSSGQTQICILFTALCSGSDILVLDEPFSHLDPYKAGYLMNYLLKEDKEIVFTTHIAEEAEALGESYVILENGKAIWSGGRKELYSQEIYEVYLLSPNDAAKIANESIKVLTVFGRTALVSVSDMSLLKELVEKGYLMGFKKAGVRGIYAKYSISN
jgi:ABC-type multidrug transport system ATPase subunit